MNYFRGSLVLMCFFVVLAFFMGFVSAASLNVSEVGLASEGVKNYTEANGNIPGYVEVADKNSSAPSFLKTLTKTTVQLNSGSTAAVNISSVSSPTGPSGSATGTLYKSEYVTVANNIYNYIDSNGRAPNYASSSLGNIRYESLVYAYARIVNFHRVNAGLPDSVSISNVVGVDAAGVVIDTVAPTVSNNLAFGTYNTVKNVTLTATDHVDANPKVYYSINDGTWNNKAKTVTLTLNQGVTTLKYYGRDAAGNQGATQTRTYTIDTNVQKFNLEELEYASSSVQAYIEAEHKLPINMTLGGTTMNMAQFLKLLTTAITNINSSSTNSSILLGNYTAAPNPSETITTSGNFNKTDYLNAASYISNFMDTNGRAPNFRTISLGNIRYESLVYTFAQILRSYQVADVLPNYIVVRPWTVVANNTTTFISLGQINNAADTVQSYIETKHKLPGHVTILESKVSMPQFLKLETMYLTNAYNNLYQSIPLGNYGTAPNPSESITGGDLNSTDYLNAASYISNFMDTNGRAPNFRDTIRGQIRFESLVYIYAEILNSASKNKRLPDYITLTPWTTVTNSNTVFVNMDQISAAISAIKSHVETSHALPSSVNISGRQITMPQFLRLEIISLKNIKAGLYQSVVLQSYSAPTGPSESLTAGKINTDNYFNALANIKSYMDSNGRAPNYAWTSQGDMRYENLIYMYSQILNYYNVNNALPQYVTVNPWSVVSNSNTVTFNVGQIISKAETIKNYVETNHALPSSVTISGTTVSMPQFLKLLTTTLHNVNGTYAGQLVLGSYGLPTDYSETITGGTLNQAQYLDLARSVEFFMYDSKRAPNYQNSSLGNIRYNSLVYMFSQILSSYKANNYTLPDRINVRPWSVVSNANTKFITLDQIKTASKNVKNSIEINHTLPSSVAISGVSVSMPKFLKLLTMAVTNIGGELNSTVVLQDYGANTTTTADSLTGASLKRLDYLNLAVVVNLFMDANNRAPNFLNASKEINASNEKIRYESLLYMYCVVMDYYNNQTSLPENVAIVPWTTLTNNNTKSYSLSLVGGAAKQVESHVEANKSLPSSVTISGTAINMRQFLHLSSTAILNIEGSKYMPIYTPGLNSPVNATESITKSVTVNADSYINLSKDMLSFMRTNSRPPENMTISGVGKLRYESLVYMYSQIISSYNRTGTLPQQISVTPWTVISNTNTKLITTAQVKTASQTVKTYVDTNHALPTNVAISGTQVTMPQFLKLLSKTIINIENYFDASVTLDSANGPTGISENITSGTILSSEFTDMATKVKSYIDSNARAPGNLTDTSIGDMIRYESLVYMFSKVMTGYNATDVAPDSVSVIPWLSLSNPNGVFNFRTQEVFTSVQAAIDDADTIVGDTIWLRKALYSENIVLNKRLTIRAVGDFNVTIQALNPALPIITINNGGSGSTIQDLILKGGLNAVGIFINSSNENEMLGCNITNVTNGVRIYNSTDNIISGCNIYKNSANGILISLGGGNEVSSNKIRQNTQAGIRIENSNKNRIYSNSLTDNQDGISLSNSDAEVHLNHIALNSRYGLYSTGNGTVNATDNWWGRNSPTVSSTSPSDIYVVGGSVTYNPRLVLTLNSQTDRSNRTTTNYKYKITADLTHNSNGADTSSDGNIPDDIPVYFNTTLGALNSTASTRKGRAELVLNSTSTGTANISVTLDNQSASKSVFVTAISVLGVTNTRTGEKFSSIQEAVDDPDTRDGDTITLDEGYYRENVAVTKRLTIKPVTGANVTVEAKDDDKSVFIINNDGSGSTIQGFDIISSLDYYGISTSHSYGNKIVNNTVSGSNRGIYLYFSGDNNVTGNTVKDGYYGIVLYESNSNTITGNTVKYNEDGIYLLDSNYNTINGNTLDSNYYGAYIYYSHLNKFTGNNVTGNWVGIYLYDTTSNNVTGNNFTDNGVGVTYINSIGTVLSENNFLDNYLTDSSSVDTGEVVMASTIYSCGPAALATILKALGIYTTEAELAERAGTDESGTSLGGLKEAAEWYGISAVGVRLTSGELKANYLVVLNIDGTNHFEVIKSINSTMVVLFDPNLGIIEMTHAKFDELYTGVAMIFGESAPENATLLTPAEMGEIKAKGGYWTKKKHSYWVPGYFYVTYRSVRVSYSLPYLYWVYVPGYTVRSWYTLWQTVHVPGHSEPRIGWRKYTYTLWYPVLHYVPPRKVTYYTYHYVGNSFNVADAFNKVADAYNKVTGAYNYLARNLNPNNNPRNPFNSQNLKDLIKIIMFDQPSPVPAVPPSNRGNTTGWIEWLYNDSYNHLHEFFGRDKFGRPR